MNGLSSVGYDVGDFDFYPDPMNCFDEYHRPKDGEEPEGGFESIDQEMRRFEDVKLKSALVPGTEDVELRVVAMTDGEYGVALGDREEVSWQNENFEPTVRKALHENGYHAVLTYSDGGSGAENPYLGEVLITNGEPLSPDTNLDSWEDTYPVLGNEAVEVQEKEFGLRIDVEKIENVETVIKEAHQTLQDIDSMESIG